MVFTEGALEGLQYIIFRLPKNSERVTPFAYPNISQVTVGVVF